jgi:hypothetical protein
MRHTQWLTGLTASLSPGVRGHGHRRAPAGPAGRAGARHVRRHGLDGDSVPTHARGQHAPHGPPPRAGGRLHLHLRDLLLRDRRVRARRGVDCFGAYSDAKVANRETWVWHLVIENGY